MSRTFNAAPRRGVRAGRAPRRAAGRVAADAVPTEKDPVAAARAVQAVREAALPRLPEPDDRRLQRRARGRPAPAGPRADRRRQDRRRDHRLHGRALRRLRPLPAAGQGHDAAALGRARRCCCCSAPSPCGAILRGRRRTVDEPPLTAEEHERAARLLAGEPPGKNASDHLRPDRRRDGGGGTRLDARARCCARRRRQRHRPRGVQRRDAARPAAASSSRPRQRHRCRRAVRAGAARARAAGARGVEGGGSGRPLRRRAPARGRPRSSARWCRSPPSCSTSLLGNPDAFSPQAREAAAKADGASTTSRPRRSRRWWPSSPPSSRRSRPTSRAGSCSPAPTIDAALSRGGDGVRAAPWRSPPTTPDLLADYADALGAAQGGTLEGKPLELVERALKVDPTHWKALALAGTAAFNRKDYRAGGRLLGADEAHGAARVATSHDRSTPASPRRAQLGESAGRAGRGAGDPRSRWRRRRRHAPPPHPALRPRPRQRRRCRAPRSPAR